MHTTRLSYTLFFSCFFFSPYGQFISHILSHSNPCSPFLSPTSHSGGPQWRYGQRMSGLCCSLWPNFRYIHIRNVMRSIYIYVLYIHIYKQPRVYVPIALYMHPYYKHFLPAFGVPDDGTLMTLNFPRLFRLNASLVCCSDERRQRVGGKTVGAFDSCTSPIPTLCVKASRPKRSYIYITGCLCASIHVYRLVAAIPTQEKTSHWPWPLSNSEGLIYTPCSHPPSL